MIRPKIATPEPPPPSMVEIPFLITAAELQDRKVNKRQLGRPAAIRRPLVELGLKTTEKS